MGKNYRLAVAFTSYALAGTALALPFSAQTAELTLSQVPLVLDGSSLFIDVAEQNANFVQGGVPAWVTTLTNDTWTSLSSAQDAYTWGEAGGGIPGSFYPNNYAAKRNYVHDFCDPGSDQTNACQYFYGGGHNSGWMNGVIKFDWYSLQWSLHNAPTPSAKYPPDMVNFITDSATYPYPWTYPSGYEMPGYYLPAPPLTDAADLPYATDFKRISSHMYGAAVLCGEEIHYFYATFGIFNVTANEWDDGVLSIDIPAQLQALNASDSGKSLQQGTIAVYDETTNRCFVTRGPGDTASDNACFLYNPTTRTVTDYIVPSSSVGGTYGTVNASMGLVSVGRKLYVFTKSNGNYGSANALNRGFIFDWDTKAIQAFTLTGDTSATVIYDYSWGESFPHLWDGRYIRRWNYNDQPSKVCSVDVTPVSGSGTSGSPYVLTQTERTCTGYPTLTKYVYTRFMYVPDYDCFVLIPSADAKPYALKLS